MPCVCASKLEKPLLTASQSHWGTRVRKHSYSHPLWFPQRREPIIKVNCGILQTSGADLFGRASGKQGYLTGLGRYPYSQQHPRTSPELVPSLAQLLRTGTYTPVSRPGSHQPKSVLVVRILMIAEKTSPQLIAVSAISSKSPSTGA